VKKTGKSVGSGKDIIISMYDRYKGKWFDRIMIKQDVVYYKDGQEDKKQIWTEHLILPGKIRSDIEEPEEESFQIAINDTQYVFRSGRLVYKTDVIHTILLLGNDIYVQKPEKTIVGLEKAGFNLQTFYETNWKGRTVFVVGAQKGDLKSNQFWVDKEHLIFVRQIKKSPMGNISEVKLENHEPVGGAWIAREVTFHTNGEIMFRQSCREYNIMDQIDPDMFDIQKILKGSP
jgi:hypothetical protein